MVAKLMFVVALGLITNHAAYAGGPSVLQGDARLACEATMCLLASSQPTECDESLKKYFSIKAKKSKNLAKARSDFLKQCPKS